MLKSTAVVIVTTTESLSLGKKSKKNIQLFEDSWFVAHEIL